jgi:hypothetical protein
LGILGAKVRDPAPEDSECSRGGSRVVAWRIWGTPGEDLESSPGGFGLRVGGQDTSGRCENYTEADIRQRGKIRQAIPVYVLHRESTTGRCPECRGRDEVETAVEFRGHRVLASQEERRPSQPGEVHRLPEPEMVCERGTITTLPGVARQRERVLEVIIEGLGPRERLRDGAEGASARNRGRLATGLPCRSTLHQARQAAFTERRAVLRHPLG